MGVPGTPWEFLQARQSGRPSNSYPDTVVSDSDANIRTEVERTVKARRMQGVFRKLVLAAYESRCCITGNPIPDLLVASHILPWVDFPKERLNPRNGLCLSAHFDRAFDRGLISFDDKIRLTLSPLLKRYPPNDSIESILEAGGTTTRVCRSENMLYVESTSYKRPTAANCP